MQTLTKSLYLNGLQCPKLLWIICHEKEKIPAKGEAAQHRFDQGKLIGELARTLYPKGIEIKAEYWELAESNEKSLKALKLRKPLFEAGFLIDGIYSRADVLLPAGKNEWDTKKSPQSDFSVLKNENIFDIIEVKSGTKLKEDYIHDVSFQKYCYEKAGLKIRKCFLMRINSDYVRNDCISERPKNQGQSKHIVPIDFFGVRKGKIDVKKLFVMDDITEKVSEAIVGIDMRIAEMLKVMESKKCPEVKIGPQCNKFYGCPLKDYCWGNIPLTSVLNLIGPSAAAFELYDSGVKNLEDIPSNYELNAKQLIQNKCAKSGKPCIQKEKIKEFLGTLKYPLYFMDFETYATAIPLYNGLKPYQPIPFQFSLHIIEKPGEKAKHYSFIAEGSKDPRKKFIEELKKVIIGSDQKSCSGSELKKGSIIVYFQSFEKGRLEELGNMFPKHKKWIKSVFERIADLIIPFSKFYYYNSKQMGSASLKDVLPVLTNKSYEGMEISGGEIASLNYLYITHGTIDGKKASANEIRKIRKDLEEYCGLDTEGMIWILEKLRELVEKV